MKINEDYFRVFQQGHRQRLFRDFKVKACDVNPVIEIYTELPDLNI